MYQEEAMAGWIHWINASLVWERPALPGGHRHLRYRKKKTTRRTRRMVNSPEDFRNHMRPGDLDFSDTQYNLKGLADFRRIAEEAGAELVLFEHKGRQQYRDIYISDVVQADWNRWWQAQPEVIELPTLTEGSFYDMKHPNGKGRSFLTAYLVEWMEHRWARPPSGWVPVWKRTKESDRDVLINTPEEVVP